MKYYICDTWLMTSFPG